MLKRFLYIFLWLSPCLLLAQQPSALQYTSDDGLAGNIVYSSLQDRDGFIWFATETGVSRFDGYRFKNYTVENGISDNEIMGMYQDSKDRLWFFGLNGTLSYYYKGAFKNPDNDSMLAKARTGSHITCAFEDHFGNLYFGTFSTGVIKITTDGIVSAVLRNLMYIVQIRDDSIGQTCAVGLEGGSRSLTNAAPFLQPEELMSGRQYNHILVLPGGRTLSVLGNRLVYLQNGKVTELETPLKLPENDRILKLQMLGNDLWVFSNTGSICVKDCIFMPENYKMYLEGKPSVSVLKDLEGNYWFTTLGDGVFMMPSAEILTFSVKEGLPDKEIFVLRAAPDGHVWFGSSNMQYGYMHAGKPVRVSPLNGTITSRVREIAFLDSGRVIIGTDGGILEYKDRKVHSFIRINSKALAVTKEGGIINGGADICRYIPPHIRLYFAEKYKETHSNYPSQLNFNPRFTYSGTLTRHVFRSRTEVIACGRGDTFWLGTPHGLICCINGDTINVSGGERYIKQARSGPAYR